MRMILGLLVVTFLASGCDNPYINPDAIKAKAEVQQVALDRRMADALERIADTLDKR